VGGGGGGGGGKAVLVWTLGMQWSQVWQCTKMEWSAVPQWCFIVANLAFNGSGHHHCNGVVWPVKLLRHQASASWLVL
jgi:hypothetical protein